jgi:hybrid cluster-associated redox disulfide protein
MAITKKMSLAEILMKHPEAAGIFQKHGLHCVGCAVAAYETLEQGALAHQIDPDALVKDLNEAIKKRPKKLKK